MVDKAQRGEINSTVLKEYTIATSNFCGLFVALTTVVKSVGSSKWSSLSIGLLHESITYEWFMTRSFNKCQLMKGILEFQKCSS